MLGLFFKKLMNYFWLRWIFIAGRGLSLVVEKLYIDKNRRKYIKK